MPIVESRPVATSIRVDHEHTLEMRADMATKTAEVENVTTGEMYTSGSGGDSDFSTAEVAIAVAMETTIDDLYLPNVIRVDESTGLAGINTLENVNNSGNIGAHTVVLYHGKSYIYDPDSIITNVTGNIEPDPDEEGNYIITGDCTITAKNRELS